MLNVKSGLSSSILHQEKLSITLIHLSALKCYHEDSAKNDDFVFLWLAGIINS